MQLNPAGSAPIVMHKRKDDNLSCGGAGRIARCTAERRTQPRLTACELVMVGWRDGIGKLNQLGNVQDLSLAGMGILVQEPLPVGAPISISYGYGELGGTVRHSAQVPDGTLIGVEFDEASKNSILHFQPELLIRE